MTGTPGGITPGAMSMAAGTPYGTTPVGYGAINTPYTPSGQTPMMTPYTTPRAHGSGASTPRQRSSAMTPSRQGPPHHSSYTMPPPLSGGSTPMGRSGRSYQPSPMYGSSNSSGGYGRSPAVARNNDRGGWQAADDAWARGSSRRTPRTNDGGHTPKGIWPL
jgi:transcription elongation factor SPT6